MLTVLEVLNLSSDYLSRKGVGDARRNAELLLCSVLDCKRINLYLNFDKPVGETELSLYRELLKRRGEREPLQYITGTAEFYGYEFRVNPSVLIPRPETEILAERVINDYKDKMPAVLDIGTGSGNIAVVIALGIQGAEVTAIDSSSDALKTAEINAGLNGCSGRIRFINADIFDEDFLKGSAHYDLIVSNPPYVPEKDFDGLEPELKVYEPRSALTDSGDGLAFYRRICELAPRLLAVGGRVYLEMGQGQCNAVYELLRSAGFRDLKITRDYQNIERVISGDVN